MSKIKKVLLVTVIVIVCIIGLLIGQVIYLAHPTKGRIIDQYENPKQALLVIDIQEDFTGTTAKAPFPYKDSDRLIRTVNAITEAASAKSMMIVYIRQELDGLMGKMLSHLFAGGVAIRGNPGTAIDKRISILSDAIFPKPRSDSFSNPELEKFLIGNHVNELYLVGLDADGCVHVTAKGALNRGYRVNIITDAVVLKDEDRWEELLAEYRQEGIQLMLSQEFLTGKSSN
ncbi:MAG: cysteine hydrolase [candidate division KSB1 bacterium]|nr:cysteine hydrolase [candidate division KSB1 bacterium]